MYCSMLDLVGKRIGDFQIETLLGKGSMARVYRAWQVSLRRAVALKVLTAEHKYDRDLLEIRERYKAEQRGGGRLQQDPQRGSGQEG